MNDLRDDLRDLFQRKAGEVPPHRDVPRSLTTRSRRRIALNAIGVGLTVVALAGGVLAGLRAIGTSAEQPGGHPSSSPSVQPSPSTTLEACTAGQLRAVGTMEGAAGSREGGVRLENLSDATCALRGRPAVTLLDHSLQPITSGVTFISSPPGWKTNRLPKPAGWPVVTLRTGESAFVRIRWSNWCPDGRPAPLWHLAVTGGGAVDVNGFDALGPPPCNGPGLPSTIEVGPFEPGSSV
jgi:hypothetical protein